MFGTTKKEELINVPAETLYADHQDRRVLFELLAKKGHIKDYDVKLKRKDGTTFNPIISVVLRKDLQGNILRSEAIIRDISERKKAEQDRGIKDFALASTNMGIAFSDLDGKVSYVNNQALKIWGYTSDKEVLGRYITDFWITSEKGTEITKAFTGCSRAWIGELPAKKRMVHPLWYKHLRVLLRMRRVNPYVLLDHSLT